MAKIKINFNREVGPVKPLHGVNNGPKTANFTYDATDYFQEAGFPFSRLHDTEYPFGGGEFVDIGCIFRRFDSDVNDPANYNFTLTDEYLKAIDQAGAKIIYRLGASIEHQPVKVHIYPPADALQWAKICEHIILHVNEGWANGMHLGIEYWEIWNEPDIPQCWAGTYEEFYALYRTAVTYLKSRFPYLKFGGPTVPLPRVNPLPQDFLRRFPGNPAFPLTFSPGTLILLILMRMVRLRVRLKSLMGR
jgi:hypothetical protein